MWKEGSLVSPGKIIFGNGNVYQGGVDNLIQHGRGELIDHDVTYIGEWNRGMLNNEVIVKYKDGTVKKAKYTQGKFDEWIPVPVKDVDQPPDVTNKNPVKQEKSKGCCTIL